MFLKLKIYFQLWWESDGKAILVVLGWICVFALYVIGTIYLGIYMDENYSTAATTVYIVFAVIFGIVMAGFIIDYNEKTETIEKKYYKEIMERERLKKTKSEEKAKEGALSKHNEFETDMKGTLHYMDEILNKKVK